MADRIPYHRDPRRRVLVNRYERTPERQADKDFYSSRAWRITRDYKLRLNPLCEEPECREVATHVHHLEPRKKRPDLAFEVDNLQALCQPCHNRQDER
jgi:5-methylcytosine-specific restriction protein A